MENKRKGIFEYELEYKHRSIYYVKSIDVTPGSIMNAISSDAECDMLIEIDDEYTRIKLMVTDESNVDFVNSKHMKDPNKFNFIIATIAENYLLAKCHTGDLRTSFASFDFEEFVKEYTTASDRFDKFMAGEVSDYYYRNKNPYMNNHSSFNIEEFRERFVTNRFSVNTLGDILSSDNVKTELSDDISHTSLSTLEDDRRIIDSKMLKRIAECVLIERVSDSAYNPYYNFTVVHDKLDQMFPDYRAGRYNQFSKNTDWDHFNTNRLMSMIYEELDDEYKINDTIYALPLDKAAKYFIYNNKSGAILLKEENISVIDEIRAVQVEKLDMPGAEEDDCVNSRSAVKSILTDAETRFIRKFELPIRILIAEDFVKGSKLFINKINIGLVVNGKFITTTEIYSPDNKRCITPDEFELLGRCVTKFINLAAKPSLVSVGSVNESIVAKELFNNLFAEEKLQRPEGVIVDDMIVYRGNINVDEQFEDINELMKRVNNIINTRFQNTIHAID